MSATLTPSTSSSPSATGSPNRSASPTVLRPILIGLGTFVGIGGIALGIALATGATVLFNFVVWALFTVLWLAFGAALAFSPKTLDDVWHAVQTLPIAIQLVAWLLFLPIMIGLWIWQRTWALPIRLLLVLALGVWNVFLFFPRG